MGLLTLPANMVGSPRYLFFSDNECHCQFHRSVDEPFSLSAVTKTTDVSMLDTGSVEHCIGASLIRRTIMAKRDTLHILLPEDEALRNLLKVKLTAKMRSRLGATSKKSGVKPNAAKKKDA